jgi:hypothetical protein
MPLTASATSRSPRKISDVMCDETPSVPPLLHGQAIVQYNYEKLLFLFDVFNSSSCLLHSHIIYWLEADQYALQPSVTNSTTLIFQPMVYNITLPVYSENNCILNTIIITACYWTTSTRKTAALCFSLQGWVMWVTLLPFQWMWNVLYCEDHIGTPSDPNT